MTYTADTIVLYILLITHPNLCLECAQNSSVILKCENRDETQATTRLELSFVGHELIVVGESVNQGQIKWPNKNKTNFETQYVF